MFWYQYWHYTAEEGTAATKHEKIFVANLKMVDEKKLQKELLSLQSVQHAGEITNILTELIPTYQTTRGKYCGNDKVKLDVKRPRNSTEQYQVVADLS